MRLDFVISHRNALCMILLESKVIVNEDSESFNKEFINFGFRSYNILESIHKNLMRNLQIVSKFGTIRIFEGN